MIVKKHFENPLVLGIITGGSASAPDLGQSGWITHLRLPKFSLLASIPTRLQYLLKWAMRI